MWNNKITRVGVAVKAIGVPFKPGVTKIRGTLKYGGVGYVKRNSNKLEDFEAYQMTQWVNRGAEGLEPIELYSVPMDIPESGTFEDAKTYFRDNLKERPVAATRWQLVIPRSELNKVYLRNVEDIFIYIYSKAFQSQKK